MKTLAINGGTPVFSPAQTFAPWPPVYAETGDKLREIYMSANWSFYGPVEGDFEKKFAAYHTAEYGIFMANGTTTLECALAALGIGPGDEVIVPSWTWMATAMAPLYLGATPVFADGEKDTFCLDPAAFEAAITPRTKAVIPVHLFGSMADMEKICAIAAKHGIAVIEDCAHAHGGKWQGKGVGSMGQVGSFSFQQTKIMTSGEGGLCTTSDPELFETISRLKHIGYAPGKKRGEVAGGPPAAGLLCHNYRATEFQAQILLDQLEHLEADTIFRAENAGYLRQKLEAIPGIKVQAPGRCATMQSYYVFGLTVDPEVLKAGLTKADVIKAVNAEGANEVFGGWGAVTYEQNLWNVSPEKYRVASAATVREIIQNRIILLGIQWLMSDRTALDKLVEAFTKVMKVYSK
ncbi:MAG: DegT/DnrJ/EryC1/StrS family aminotransferase [Lentisphaeria bacterium]|nr:DegT/DnrJ/EryC1/StrS family aminotransferase [Lentisphaeria bacterium]